MWARASAFFIATRVGGPTLRVASPALPSATQVQTVTCGPPTRVTQSGDNCFTFAATCAAR